MKLKFCIQCCKDKPINGFHVDNRAKDGLNSYCKECINKQNNLRYHSDAGKEYMRQYNQSDKCKESRKKYRQSEKCRENKKRRRQSEKGRKYAREYYHNVQKNNILYRVNKSVSTGICSSLNGNKRGRHWEDLVGYTLDELMCHLEEQFTEGMSWNNYGDWHVDHLMPLCSFEFYDVEDQAFKDAWSLENLRPLWAEDNQKKGGKRDVA